MTVATVSALAGLRLLVVEDEYMVAEHIESMLEDLGCLVAGSVATVEEALAIVHGEPLDGALLDGNLNGESSAPIAAALLARKVPFVVVTGYGRCGLATDALNAAPRLAKPFNKTQLETTLTEAFLP